MKSTFVYGVIIIMGISLYSNPSSTLGISCLQTTLLAIIANELMQIKKRGE